MAENVDYWRDPYIDEEHAVPDDVPAQIAIRPGKNYLGKPDAKHDAELLRIKKEASFRLSE